MQFGLYHLSEWRAWRKVSADSGGQRSVLMIDCAESLSLPLARRVLSDTQCFPHIAKFIYVTTTIEVVLITFARTLHRRLDSIVYQLPIVTAAVYRGFGQQLRLAADPIN